MAPLAEELLANPVTLAVITVTIAALVAWQRTLGPDIDWFWRTRRVAWPLADTISREHGRAWTREKDAEEYVFSVDATRAEIDSTFHAADYDPNGLATLKYVLIGGRKVYEIRSFAWRENFDADDQTHAYVFAWGDAMHCHQHVEPNTTDPGEHHHGEQVPGDPEGRLHDAFAAFDVYDDPEWLERIED